MLPWLKTTPGNDPGHRFSNFSECKNHPHVLLNQIYEPSPKDSCVSAPKIHLGWSLRFFISKQFQDNSLLSICEVQSEYWCSREWYQRLPENRKGSHLGNIFCSIHGLWTGSISISWDILKIPNLRLWWIRICMLLPRFAGDRHVH